MRRWLAIAAVLLLIVAGFAVSIAQSSWFAARVTQHIQEEVVRVTGARVEIANLSLDWRGLRVHTGPLAIHGTEPPEAPPLLSARDVEVGLKVVSLFQRRVDVRSVVVIEPRVNLIVQPDGSTNIPGRHGGQLDSGRLIDLAIGHLEIRDGELAMNDRRIPLELRAERVRSSVDYRPIGRLYSGEFSAGEIRAAGVSGSADIRFDLDRSRLSLGSIVLKTQHSIAEGKGVIEDWNAPRAEFDLALTVDVPEAARLARITGLRTGTIHGPVHVAYDSTEGWHAQGQISARNLSVSVAGEKFDRVSGSANATWRHSILSLDSIEASVLGGKFQGVATWRLTGDYSIQGAVKNVSFPREISAKMTGPVQLLGKGLQIRTAEAELELEPGTGAVPVGGTLRAAYDGVRRTATIRSSSLTLGGSRIDLSGEMQSRVEFRLTTRDPNEILPALRLLSPDVPEVLPVGTGGGLVTARGFVTGPVDAPRITATLDAERVTHGNRVLTGLHATGTASPSELSVTESRASYAGASLGAAFRLQLTNWRATDGSAITADGEIRNGDLAAVLKDIGASPRAQGKIAGRFRATGTLSELALTGTARVDQPRFGPLYADRAEAAFFWRDGLLTISSGEAFQNGNRIALSGAYRPTGGEWGRGEVSLEARSASWKLPSWGGRAPADLSGSMTGAARIDGNEVVVTALNGTLDAAMSDLGKAHLDAKTSGSDLSLTGEAAIGEATLSLQSSWKLTPGLPGAGSVVLKNLTPEVIRTVWAKDAGALPFTGLIEGGATVEGRLTDPDQLVARVSLSTVRLEPRQEVAPGITAADLTIRNEGDIVLDAGTRGIVVEKARFVAKDTLIDAAGNLATRTANAWNFLLRGRLNLAVLGTFRPDLVSSGIATMDTRIRGTLSDPQVQGRMQLAGASFYLRNIPNGLAKVNGSVLFDRRRVTIESLTGETGGGTLRLGGFVGFGSDLSYQLQAQADRVRVRYPEGISTQASGQLTLTGTSRRGMLSGTLTILRSAIGATTDTARLIGRSNRIAGIDASNEFLRGLQFDIRVETSQSAEFSTELTKNVQADVDLRLRGTPARPILLGRVSITQGQVQFYGTDYRINRGEITFVNPVRVEPQIDLDLETRVRGIQVSVNFAGPLSKMNMSYRSDPPLQSSEILALLAVGRTPTTATQAGVGTVRGQDLLGGGGNAILDSALNAPSNSSLQRFFGVSRVKIDPQLIGLDNTPQARLSVEQPISRDVSVTYVTRLNRAQNQLVRVQWDLSREWSAIATRDENGVLSVDFVFKRSFK